MNAQDYDAVYKSDFSNDEEIKTEIQNIVFARSTDDVVHANSWALKGMLSGLRGIRRRGFVNFEILGPWSGVT